MKELLIAANPDSDSSLAYIMRVPLGEGIVLRTSGTWPRTKALYCYPVPPNEWPEAPELVERVPLRAAPGAERRSTSSPPGRGRTGPSSSSPPPGDATRCSGSHRAPASRLAPRLSSRPLAPPAWRSWRSSSAPTSATPIALPPNKSGRPSGRCPAVTTGSFSMRHWSPRSSANRSPT